MSRPSSLRASLVVAGCLLATLATSPGQTYVISTFNGSLTGALGVTSSALAGAYLVGTLLSAASLTTVGKVADRVGPRRMIVLASLGLALGGFALSRAAGMISVVLAFYLLRVTGQGALSLASSHALALRHEARLGSVEGLRGATISVAIGTAPLISIALIEQLGWRTAAWVLGAGAGGIGIFAALVLIDRDPSEAESVARLGLAKGEGAAQGHTLPEARRTGAFWILTLGVAMVAAALTAVHFHLQPLLQEAGLDVKQATSTFISFAASGLVATLVGGLLADRVHPGRLLGGGLLLLAAGTMGCGLATSPLMAHASMGSLGLAQGLVASVGAPTLARFFGRAHHGAIRGFSGSVGVAAAAMGPWVVGITADGLGAFRGALLGLGVLILPMAIMGFRLRRPQGPLSTVSGGE